MAVTHWMATTMTPDGAAWTGVVIVAAATMDEAVTRAQDAINSELRRGSISDSTALELLGRVATGMEEVPAVVIDVGPLPALAGRDGESPVPCEGPGSRLAALVASRDAAATDPADRAVMASG